ncbi:MAG: cysteine synthase [Lentisphaerae bacterium GWF2_44_16]|nr:MAG: cysteine synthase [Lentisphaerae bacterium GWF2_44_16]
MKENALCKSVLDAIGNTPLVELSRLVSRDEGRIFAKLEYLNPGFSKKDRAAKQILEDAEKSGELRPGQTVVELTSGNMGTGLAIVCAIKGYHFVAVMSRGNSIERARMMAALGAEVILVNQLPGSTPGQVSGDDLAEVEKVTRQIVKERNAFRADQFNHMGNFRAHYLNTAREIIEQADGCRIDAFCDFAGTGGSFSGISKALKEHNPALKAYLVEPEKCAVLSGKKLLSPNHKIQGGGYSMAELRFIDKKTVDGYLRVSDEEAVDAARKLAEKEGLFAGFSSGANAAAAMKLLKGELRGKSIVVLLCDSGLKYLSTDLWKDL